MRHTARGPASCCSGRCRAAAFAGPAAAAIPGSWRVTCRMIRYRTRAITSADNTAAATISLVCACQSASAAETVVVATTTIGNRFRAAAEPSRCMPSTGLCRRRVWRPPSVSILFRSGAFAEFLSDHRIDMGVTRQHAFRRDETWKSPRRCRARSIARNSSKMDEDRCVLPSRRERSRRARSADGRDVVQACRCCSRASLPTA